MKMEMLQKSLLKIKTTKKEEYIIMANELFF